MAHALHPQKRKKMPQKNKSLIVVDDCYAAFFFVANYILKACALM